MGEWSPEATGGKWVGGASGPAMGTKFRGTNSSGRRSWSTVATVTEFDAPNVFAFTVIAGPGLKVATWRYRITATAAGANVEETWIDTRGAIIKFLGKKISGVADRASHNRAGMEATLESLAKSAAEAR